MSPKDLINEIVEVKNRKKYKTTYIINQRIEEIEKSLKNFIDCKGNFANNEIIKYFPIGIVALIEAFTRNIIKNLIDHGKPYIDNIIKLEKKCDKLDFKIITEIQKKNITIGEFVSHVLSINNMENIISILSLLTNSDFFCEFKTFISDYDSDYLSDEIVSLKNNFNETLENINNTFKLRHIFCHESIPQDKVDVHLISKCFESSKIFILSLDTYIHYILYGPVEKSAREMYDKVIDEFNVIDNELKKVLTIIYDSDQDIYEKKLLLESIKIWEQYREQMATAITYQCRHGNLGIILSHECKTNITKHQIAALKEEFAVLFESPSDFSLI